VGPAVKRAQRAVPPGHELMLVVVPEDVHEGLVTKALRHGMSVDRYVAGALALLAKP
jgi:predicted HicB family RNase H-like nuclease